jgi:multiple sugar transport system substrate-binding protein
MLAAIPALLLGGCGSTTVTPSPTPVATATPVPTPTPIPPLNRSIVRWFVGIGAGNDATQVAAEKAFVDAYNASQGKIYISLEIVPNASAYDVLAGELAAGTGPDIVGPVGYKGLHGLTGNILDLTSEITKNSYDRTRFPAAVMDYWKQGGAQIGLPYLIYPGFIFYNKDIFAKASLPNLPKKVGEKWNGQDWTWDTLATVAAQLTVDNKGKKSTDAGFNAAAISQYGVDFQWSDARRMASCFSPGTFAGPDGNATIPDGWTAAWKWYYNAMWKTHIAPTGRVLATAQLNYGSTISTGAVAMEPSWAWAIDSYSVAGKAAFAKWDMAVMPSYKGTTTSPMDASTFLIMKTTAHPDDAFQAMTAIMADKTLQKAYLGMPAATADQKPWFTAFDAKLATAFPDNTISWTVLQEMENYPAVPSQEADVPGYLKVVQLYTTFYNRFQTTNGLNMDNEISKLKYDIQRAFLAAQATPTPGPSPTPAS